MEEPPSEDRTKILFILGAGASVDSGLGTFRGPTGTIPINNEEFYKNLISNVSKLTPGKTYVKMNNMVKKLSNLSFCITQNIDGLIRSVDIDTVEIHLRNKKLKYKNIVMVGQTLPEDKVIKIYKRIKLTYDYVLVIGTTCEYPYIREWINKSKRSNGYVIHINPDLDYRCHLKEDGYRRDGSIRYKTRGNEQHWVMSAYEGLHHFETLFLTPQTDAGLGAISSLFL